MVAVIGLAMTVYSGVAKNTGVVGLLEQPLQSDATGQNQVYRTSPVSLMSFSNSTGQWIVKNGPTVLTGLAYINAGTNWTVTIYNRGTAITDTGTTASPKLIIHSTDISFFPMNIPIQDSYFSAGILVSAPTSATKPGGNLTAGSFILYNY